MTIGKTSPTLLKSGTVFHAEDKLHRTYRYEMLGVDLADLENGVGCRYIVLRNLDTGTNTCVEARWFTERKITICEKQNE